MDPLVSVIIPTFNRANLIRASIDTVRKQTHQNFEILVIDDGSTDNTREVIKSIDYPIHYIYKPNTGPAPTRNIGIKNARGTYIAFLDSDDLWDETKLEKQVAEFKKDPNVVLVSVNYRFIDQNNNVVKDPGARPGYTPAALFINDLIRIQFPFGATSQFMLRRDIFDAVGFFNEKLRISEDLDLLIRIGVKYKISYVDQVLTSVRLHENHSMRETPRYQVWLNSVRVYESHRKEIAAVVPHPQKYFANFYSVAGNSALLSGQRGKALECYLSAVGRHPLNPKGYKDCLRCFLPMSYLKARYQQSLKVEIPEVLRNYQ